MEKFIIEGGRKLTGEISVSGAKNVAMKVLLTGLLTSKPIHVENIPLISSVMGTAELIRYIGIKVSINKNHTMEIHGNGLSKHALPLDMGGLYRTATMVLGPLLQRFGKAVVPNPGGCRLGLRPVDWHIEGLKRMGAKIKYDDGFFYASCKKLIGVKFKFPKNSHTGTETLILAAVKAQGETTIENAATEPEVDDLIKLLVQMGARIKRVKERTLVIKGVTKLKGTDFRIMPDRNEAVTFAIGAIASKGKVVVKGAQKKHLTSFLENIVKIGASYKIIDDNKIVFFSKKKLKPISVTTNPHPGFMTDWQAPWTLLMTQADGQSQVVESIFENRFSYVKELSKMGARIEPFHPEVSNPKSFYNFSWTLHHHLCQGIKITGPTPLHEGVLEVTDLRAGATLMLAAVIAHGKSIVYGIEHIDRGYENIENRISSLGIKIKRLKD